MVMRSIVFSALLCGLAACAGTGPGSVTEVRNVGPDDLLKLRSGPGLGFSVVLGLPDGTSVTRRDCVTEAGQLWCNVALTAAPGITGFVSADYLAAR